MSASDVSPDEWTFIQTGYATEKEFLAARLARTAVYRMFDKPGNLLYVGITGVMTRRVVEQGRKPWASEVKMITLEWHPSRAQAEKAELTAIRTENPRYNIAGKVGPRARILRHSGG